MTAPAQVDLFASDDTAVLRRRIADLEDDVTAARAAERTERERREAAELSRDQWATIAGAREPAELRGQCDPLLAVDQAYAAARRADHRVANLEGALRTEWMRRDGLAQIVWALKRLPVAPAKMHPDAVRALAWLLTENGRWEAGVSGAAPALPDDVVVEVQHLAVGWRAVEVRSLPAQPSAEVPA